MESLKYIKMGFMIYIGATIAEILDKKYRTKVINFLKNFNE